MTNLINARNCSGYPVHLIPLSSFVSFSARRENIFTNFSNIFVCHGSHTTKVSNFWDTLYNCLNTDCDYNCSALPFPFFPSFFVGETFSRNCGNFDLVKWYFVYYCLCSDSIFFIFLVKYIFKIAETLIKIILVILKRETQYIWDIIIGNLEYSKYYLIYNHK